jgi:hypothetical protein
MGQIVSVGLSQGQSDLPARSGATLFAAGWVDAAADHAAP